MNHRDFKDWQSYPVTKAFYSAINEKIEGLKNELSWQAGADQRADSVKVGAIQALRDILDADWFEGTQDD
jgi:hypothetical protein